MGVRSEPSQRKVAQLFRRRHEENTKMKHLALLSMVTLASCAPQSLVVATTGPPCVDDEYDEGCIEVNDSSTISTTTTTTTEKLVATEPLETTKFHIKSEFQFRYARTVVESAVSNPDTVAQIGSFSLIIPDSAFISAFSMEMDGEEFKARVEGKEEAEKTFEKALSRGRGAGLVSQDAKDANKFTVSTNIEGGQEVVFRLTYDELLGRKEGKYRQETNIDPQQIVEDFRVEVFINESLPITEVNVPELLQSNSIDPSEETQNSFVTIDRDFEGDAKNAKKDKKAEALTLALENHFVTPVTSLVVVRPDEEDSLADVDDDPTIDYDYPLMYSMSYAAPAAAAYQPQRFASKIVGGRAPYPASPQAYRPKSKISPIAASNSYHLAYDDTGSGYESFSYYDASYDYVDDYAAITSTTVRNNLARTTTTTTFSTSTTSTTTSQPETCQLTPYSKTYNRGEEMVLLDDSADLGSFSDLAISALVEGSCCWQLFGEVNFAGPSAWVRPGGVYKGTDSFGRQLFQEVTSLRRVQC